MHKIVKTVFQGTEAQKIHLDSVKQNATQKGFKSAWKVCVSQCVFEMCKIWLRVATCVFWLVAQNPIEFDTREKKNRYLKEQTLRTQILWQVQTYTQLRVPVP